MLSNSAQMNSSVNIGNIVLRKLAVFGVLVASFSAFAPLARANSITFSASGTNNLGNSISASATFTTSGSGTLTVVLTNTDSALIHAGGADALTGLYFSDGGVALTPVSASLTSGSTMLPATANPSVIPTSWGFTTAPSGVPAPAGDWAIGATGLIGGSGNYDFTDTYHNSPGYLAGPNYGILGNASDTYGGFSPMEATSVTFTFDYTGTISSFTGIDFLYGTSSGEGLIAPPSTPVPDGVSTFGLLGVVFLGLAAAHRRHGAIRAMARRS
jgi:hypothetical protein